MTVTMFADTLLDFALAIAKPASLTNSFWLQQLALTLYTRWSVALSIIGVKCCWTEPNIQLQVRFPNPQPQLLVVS